jgi:hypothetical protein
MTYPPPPPGQQPYPPSSGEPLPPPVDPYDSPQHTEVNYGHPDYGQPGYGAAAPGPAAPGPAAPGPAAPGPAVYRPAAYGQPGHVPPGYPMASPPSPASGSRTVAITLVSVAIALVVLVGGGTVVYLISEQLGGGSGSTQGKGVTASPSQTVTAAAEEISISEPDTLNGQPKIEAEELESLTTDLEDVLEGYPGAANAFGAVYGSFEDKNVVTALAAEVDIDDSQGMLDRVFQSFSGESQLTGVTPASTGSLGGVAQCGSAVIGKENVAICGWADEGSVGMILYFYKTAVDVKGDFPDMRAEIETKG